MLDLLLAEYKWNFRETLFRFPLSTAFVLYAAIAHRHQQKIPGPTYEQRDMLARIDQLLKANKKGKNA